MRKSCFGKLHYVLLIMVISFSFLSASGQGYNTTNWRFSNPKQFGFTVLDVDYFDNNNVIAVGSDGGIAKSTDGGTNWTYGVYTYLLPTGVLTKPTFNDVHYVTANIAYAVGTPGCMAKTTDGGATWNFITTPLYANQKNINTLWFLNKDTGYIAGQFNTLDSLPKLYYTRNGGSTWDSISAPPANGVTRCGYINNVNIPSVLLPVDAKAKEIFHIEFVNDNLGYVCGSASPLFPRVSANAVAATCLPSTGNLTTGAHTAALLWKFSNGVLSDYSISKERIGYTGINTNTVTCTTGYANLTPAAQTYRAMSILNDTTVLLMSFNNNTVVRVSTGRNDSTANVNAPGQKEVGKYTVLNFPFPPTGGPNAGPAIPNPQVLLASNPYYIRKASNGKLFAAANFGYVWTSTDNGANWKQEYDLPQGQNYSGNGTWAFDIAPNGKCLAMGSLGVVADSVPGTQWKSVYVTTPASGSYNKIEFADCANGMAVGGFSITTTADGGKTWTDKFRSDFQALNYNITSFCYPAVNRSYYALSAGLIYTSTDQGTTLDPVYTNLNYQFQDVASIGTNVWAIGYSAFSVATASKTAAVFRSTNNGTTWTVSNPFAVGSTFQSMTDIEFPSSTVGYAAGNKDTVWKTTDGGATWNKLPLPFPGVTPQITYTDMFALDNNTVFLCGNGFPRKVVIKTTDGGATWQDITSNITTIYPVGNMNGVLFHDANNGYVTGPGGALLVTTNGGASWTLDYSPSATISQTMAFAPKTVPAGTPFANRKMFMCGGNISGAPIMEYGKLSNLNVTSTEVLGASCDNANTGTITVNATGGIAPYTYSLDGGTFQTSNVFTNLSPSTHQLIIRDNACGVSTRKDIIVPGKFSPVVSAGADVTIMDGDQITLHGSSNGNTVSVNWTPAGTLTGANTFSPSANPRTNTTYTITVQDANGCSKTDDVLVTVIPYCVKVMDAFTPNGDGQNDRWLVTNGGSCTKKNSVAVYNRYGSLVYKNDDYKDNWDGTYNGKALADGVYYYKVTLELINGKQIVLQGDVTILR